MSKMSTLPNERVHKAGGARRLRSGGLDGAAPGVAYCADTIAVLQVSGNGGSWSLTCKSLRGK